ncbi:DUF1428 domain-containing protein [Luteimonas sp. e5]
MIFGGFAAILDVGDGTAEAGYVDGMVLPVPQDNRAAYLDLAKKTADTFAAAGALRVVETWSDDVPEGRVTDFRRAVLAEPGEAVVFSFIQWPDKATRDDAWQALMADPETEANEMPFDGRRMFWGGFRPLLEG